MQFVSLTLCLDLQDFATRTDAILLGRQAKVSSCCLHRIIAIVRLDCSSINLAMNETGTAGKNHQEPILWVKVMTSDWCRSRVVCLCIYKLHLYA